MSSSHERGSGHAKQAIGVFLGVCAPFVAHAQTGLIVQPAIPQGFDRGRNVSVLESSRPSYTPVGVSVGGLLLYPQVETGAGATSNAYLAKSDGVAATYFSIEPSLSVSSIWSRHSLEINASTVLRDYVGEARRNERDWDLNAAGSLQFGRRLEITANIGASQETEDPFSGEVVNTVLALSRFRRNFAAVRGDYVSGRVRVFALTDQTSYRFRPIPLSDGIFSYQGSRNRNVSRVIGQVEYARTPSVSLFAQLSYTNIKFTAPVTIGPGLNSGAVRILGGANIDLSGRARGTLGLGYIIRNYRSLDFIPSKGMAAEAQLELFPSRLLTVTTGVRRSIEDSTSGNTVPRPFWNNNLSVRADYELLNNLIFSAGGDFALQSYIVSNQRSTTYRLSNEAKYLVSRKLTLNGSVSYTTRRTNNERANEFSEGRIEFGLAFHI